MRIVVTGGAGFIGSHLCERLLEERHEVICLDNYASGSKRNLFKLIGNARFEVIRHDIIHYIDIECDQIYNLACPPLPASNRHDPIRIVHANVFGVTNMLELARRTGARVLHASTSGIYGNAEARPQLESCRGDVDPVGEHACYEEGKRVAETLLMDYHRRHGVDVRIARIFDTYGPRMGLEDGRAVGAFVSRALLGRPLTVRSDGVQARSLCYVSDMVDGLITLMNEEGVTGPVNLGGVEAITTIELAGIVIELTGSTSVIESSLDGQIPCASQVRCRPDITLARLLLGWSPRVSVRQGLVPTIEYVRSALFSAGVVWTSDRAAEPALRSFAPLSLLAKRGGGNGRRNGGVKRRPRGGNGDARGRQRRLPARASMPRRRGRFRSLRRGA